MRISQLIEDLAEVLEIEYRLKLSTNLKELPEFDSLALMSVIALVDEKFGKKLSAKQLINITTIESLVELIGKEHFG